MEDFLFWYHVTMQLTIHGDAIHDLDSFYDEVQKSLCPKFSDFGRNIDAFNDILRGGFGTFEYGEKVTIEWLDSDKGRQVLGDERFDAIIKTIKYGHGHELILR